MPLSEPKKKLLLLYLFTPLAALALLAVLIPKFTKDRGDIRKNQPAIGAGAGDTGGANGIGEELRLARLDEKAAADAATAQQAAAANASQEEMIDPTTLEQGFLLVVQDKTGKSSASSPIYVAGNFNNWNPKDDAAKLTPQSDMRWRILMKKPRSLGNASEPIKFKFTRGDWALEELKSDLTPPTDRLLPKIPASSIKPGEPPQIELVIEAWGDMRPDFVERAANDPYRTIKAKGDVRRVQVAGGVINGRPRELLVWLPPGYEAAAKEGIKFPVLYMHDGQNVFEKLPNVPGEWQADETAFDLISKGMARATIIVGIPHSGSTRLTEYTPTGITINHSAFGKIEGRGDEHVRWLVNEVMPRVERSFAVSLAPKDTAIGGSSMGAVISMLAVAKNPGRFGGLLLESLPSVATDVAQWKPFVESVKVWPDRIYLGVGGSELGDDPKLADANKKYAQATKDLDAHLAKAGLSPDRKLMLIDPKAVHNEGAWAARFDDAFSFLFPPAVDGTK
jgi:predicted alpha/beta superfamily hydrolase